MKNTPKNDTCMYTFLLTQTTLYSYQELLWCSNLPVDGWLVTDTPFWVHLPHRI